MLDSSLRRLLDEVINTSTKLAITLLYAGQPRLVATPMEISQRIVRDKWSVEQALHELADDALLVEEGGLYRYAPSRQLGEAVDRFLLCYDEPLLRQEILRIVDDLDRYAPYRDMLTNRSVMVY
jgi:hypothetical protein